MKVAGLRGMIYYFMCMNIYMTIELVSVYSSALSITVRKHYKVSSKQINLGVKKVRTFLNVTR